MLILKNGKPTNDGAQLEISHNSKEESLFICIRRQSQWNTKYGSAKFEGASVTFKLDKIETGRLLFSMGAACPLVLEHTLDETTKKFKYDVEKTSDFFIFKIQRIEEDEKTLFIVKIPYDRIMLLEEYLKFVLHRIFTAEYAIFKEKKKKAAQPDEDADKALLEANKKMQDAEKEPETSPLTKEHEEMFNTDEKKEEDDGCF